jgi:hypothetical protein
LRFASLIIWITLLAGHAAAQDHKSNPDLFLQCTDYDSEREKLHLYIESQKSVAGYRMDEKARLNAKLDAHERELKRLDEILKVIHNNQDLYDQRNREYNQYSRAFREYEAFMVDYRLTRADLAGGSG